MNRQTIGFAVKKTGGVVTAVGRSYIAYPKIRFKCGSIRWHEDKPKQQYK